MERLPSRYLRTGRANLEVAMGRRRGLLARPAWWYSRERREASGWLDGGSVARSILIADDSAAIRDVLREALVDEGYDVAEVSSGDGVLAAFNGSDTPKPDLALMDIRMPGKDGLEVLRALRASRDDELPVIVMTAFGSASTAIEAMKLGAFDYIAKPFELDEVNLAVERFFERRELSDRVVRLLAENDRQETL